MLRTSIALVALAALGAVVAQQNFSIDINKVDPSTRGPSVR